jgi:very-short-patch-repair endonuclease
MASLFTTSEAIAAGISYEAIRWKVKKGTYVRLTNGVYFKGDRPPMQFELRLAEAMKYGKTVTGELAAALHGFDGFSKPRDAKYGNVKRSGAHETLVALAATTGDIVWEQALEWCLRKGYTTVDAIKAELKTQRYGNNRIRRVLKIRPDGTRPTGSILETMAVQLIRRNPMLPTPERQVNVRHWFVDLAWPQNGVFLELDGEWHEGQPHYDAVRQTGVTAATGWLVGRYTWTDIVDHPKSTLRSIAELLAALRNNTRGDIGLQATG